MSHTWNEAKRVANLVKHAVDFEAADGLDWDGAAYYPDRRVDYGEERTIAFGNIDGRLHVAVFTERNGVRHIISLRKANNREKQKYERETQT